MKVSEYLRGAGSMAQSPKADGRAVTLSGRVRSWNEKDQAESAAWNAPGVNIVRNDIDPMTVLRTRTNSMVMPNTTMARQVAEAASRFQEQRTGHAPRAVTVVLGEDTLVVTLHDALSPAEKALSKTPEGAAQVQEYHRQLFANDSEALRQEIKRITGINVREATAEVEPASGAVVQAFTTGTVVQVFSMDGSSPTETWSGTRPEDP